MLYDIKNESMPREELKALQLKRLQDVCRRVYATVPFYRKRFDEAGIKPADVRSLEDLKRLPFTVKQDLRSNYPFGTFAVPRDNIARIHASSGTTGQAVVVGYTQYDLDVWAQLMSRCLVASGVKPQDVVHVAYGYGLFTGGLGAHDGATKLGCMVVPASGGSTRRQVGLIRDLGATVLACTPSYAMHLWEVAMENGINFRDLPLRVGVFGGEPWTDAMRQTIEDKMGIDAHNIYGLSEIMGPGCAIDCSEHDGLHVWEDHFLCEIIDPQTGEQLPEGEQGELVITNLTKQGSPLIRYRTRDLTTMVTEPCRCGRTHARISRFAGRSDDMLIIRGVNVFPTQIESVIMEFAECNGQYLITVDRVDNTDTFRLDIELRSECYGDMVGQFQSLIKAITGRISSVIGIKCDVHVVEPNAIERSAGKAKHVVDLRKI